MKIRTLVVRTIAASVFGLAAASTSASIIFTLGNNPQPDEVNILFGLGETGTTINGEVDATAIAPIFSSSQSLTQKAQGQADIFATGSTPANPILLTDITFTLGPGLFFTDFIMNPQNGSGTATVSVQPLNEPPASFTYPNFGNGQNFLTITTAGGELMSSVTLQVSGGGFADFKQPRVSGACQILTEGGPCVPIGEVAEPATLLLLGAGLFGLGVVGRRQKT